MLIPESENIVRRPILVGQEEDIGDDAKLMELNIGPSHPAMHGTLQLMVKLDGETIAECVPEIGYLHRCFEKTVEEKTWTKVTPYTDRLNYLSPLLNNVGYALAVEKLLGIRVPKRCEYLRVIVGEMSRIMDHLVCIGTNAVDIGALTNFWYFYEYREYMYDLIERLTGHRLTNNYTRIGGVSNDVDEDWVAGCRKLMDRIPEGIAKVDKLLTRNRIFMDRMVGVGAISADQAIEWGYTGPCLRACGVDYDVRKDYPYSSYDDFDFEVPIAKEGDNYSRYLVRMEEMRQSIRIIQQALDKLPDGPVCVDDPRVFLPPKSEVYGSIEGLMNHFKLIMEGIQAPVGEVYSYTEAGNGELGFYIVSKGGGRPYRIKIRPPCFAIYSAFHLVSEGEMIADAMATIGQLNVVAGELDR